MAAVAVGAAVEAAVEAAVGAAVGASVAGGAAVGDGVAELLQPTTRMAATSNRGDVKRWRIPDRSTVSSYSLQGTGV